MHSIAAMAGSIPIREAHTPVHVFGERFARDIRVRAAARGAPADRAEIIIILFKRFFDEYIFIIHFVVFSLFFLFVLYGNT